VSGKLGVFTETLGFFWHNVDIRADLETSSENHYFLSIDSLILLKSQFIRFASESEINKDDFRFLEPFDDNRGVLGMEPKDTRDVCAALNDHGDEVTQSSSIPTSCVGGLPAVGAAPNRSPESYQP
jgi:hypothetical protein